ncbi:hypothetical protein MRX96_056120 [Rhipicephalus microplus]
MGTRHNKRDLPHVTRALAFRNLEEELTRFVESRRAHLCALTRVTVRPFFSPRASRLNQGGGKRKARRAHARFNGKVGGSDSPRIVPEEVRNHVISLKSSAGKKRRAPSPT